MLERPPLFVPCRRVARGAAVLVLTLPLACKGAGDTRAMEPSEETYRYEAAATPVPGVYHVVPAFDEIDRVELVRTSDSECRRLEPGREWSFEPETHALALGVSVDVAQRVVVWGERSVPWRWKLGQPMAPGSVQALFGDRPGERGRDYEAHESEGSIELLRPELCDPAVSYCVTYQLQGDPEQPELTTSVSFGNHTDPSRVRSSLDLPERTRRVIPLGRSLEGDVRVLLGERLLEEGIGYTVDREAGEISILDQEFFAPGARYFISAGNLAVGNTSLTPRMQELLSE